MPHSEQRKEQETSLPVGEPPSSPPTNFLLIRRIMTQNTATTMNTTTLNPRDPALTKYPLSLASASGANSPNLNSNLAYLSAVHDRESDPDLGPLSAEKPKE